MSVISSPSSGSSSIRNAPSTNTRVDFICGWSAGCIETIVLYPTSKLIFRQQLHGLVMREALYQLKTEGIGLLYRGLLPPLIMRTTARSIMFGMYEKYQRIFMCHPHPTRDTINLCHAKAAFCAGLTEALLCPFERIQTLLQSNAYHDHFKNTHGAFMVVRQYGFPEFYRGFSLVMFRNGLSNTIFFTLRDPLSEHIFNSIPYEHRFFRPLSEFCSGGLLGASISTLFYPVNVVKARAQSTLGTPFMSPITIFKIVWNERNGSLRGLFRGVQLNFTRSCLAWGITNTAYETLKRNFG